MELRCGSHLVEKHTCYIAAHEIAKTLGLNMSTSLPFFHAFTGCDTVSCFNGKGKRTARDTWQPFPDVTEAFLILSCSPNELTEDSVCFDLIQRFVVLMYDRNSDITATNEVRKYLFSRKSKDIESIPPTSTALLHHSIASAQQKGSFSSRPYLGYCFKT